MSRRSNLTQFGNHSRRTGISVPTRPRDSRVKYRGRQHVYLWLDGVYLKAGLEKEKGAAAMPIGVKADGHKVLLAVTSGYRESTASWGGVLRDLKARGMNEPRLLVWDGNLGLWSVLGTIFPRAKNKRC